ncbi:T9SS type A sorting domain-containing protein [Cryomorphaceae bacterium 1068]|nr:T9SS type A sorting domain-containing protein [Cryomorphaceae bacterium 1068]
MKKLSIILIGFLTSLFGFTQSLDPVTLSTNGSVEVIEKSGDTLFVGGSFSEIGYSASYVSLIDPATNLPTSDGPFLNSSVYANISDGAGGWYIGGFFTTINGETTNRVAHILPNLSVDQNFDCEVNGLAESFFLDGSDLYIGGSFTTVNSLTVNRLVRVNATTGAIDGGWLPEVSNGTVNDIIREGDFVYAGGTFSSIEGTNDRRYLTRFSVTTGLADDFISVNSTVNDLLFEDNNLYVGGAFSSLSYFKSHLAFFNEGEQIPLFDRDDVNSTVDVILSDGNGGWYIGGSFFTFGSTNSTRLIHLNSDGSLDTDFQPETINSTVASLHLDGNELYLGGSFTSIGGNPFNRLARMDATTGAIDATWLPNLANGSVNAIRTSPTEVIIGGTFTTINASNNNRYFARLDRTTGAIISAPSVNSTVHDFEESSNGVYLAGAFTNSGYFQPNLGIVDANTALADQSFPDANSSSQVIIDDENGGWFIGGSFSTIEGQSTTRLTHILSDYSIDPNFNCSPNSTVEALFLDGNDLYIGGSFSSVNGVTITRLAKVNATDGTVDAAWNPAPNSTVLSITDAGDNILAGGFFTAVGDRVTDRYMVRVGKASGETIQTLAPNSTVSAFEPSADGLYAGGSFTEVGYYHPNLARLSGNSTTPNRDFPTTNSTVLGVIDDGSGGFYMHGQFTQVDGVSKTRIAHILPDGSVDLDFDANINNTVNDIFLEGNDLYVGGTFTSINSQSAIRVAKLNAITGELDTDFTPDVNSTVESVSFDNGVLYIGGSFTLINGITRNRLAALDANGDPTAWDPNVNSTVLEIKSFNGSIYVGGSFNTIGGITSNRIAAIDPITGALESFDAGSVNSTVNDFEFSGTSLFIGGSFTSIEGNTRGRIAELNANTGALQPLDISFNSTVEDIAVSGNLLGIGGFFTTVDGASQPYFAEIDINTNTLTDRILGLNSFVYGLNYEGSDLILVGSFNLVGSSQIQRILEYDPITDELTSFNAGTVNGSVEAIHLLDGELFIGGSFTSVNGSPRQRLASIDPETASVNALDVQFNSTIQSLDSQDDRLYAAGFFTTVNGNNDRGVVAIDLTDGTLADWDANPSGSIEVVKATPAGIILGGSFQYLNNVDLQRLAEFDFVENNMSVVFDGNINSTVEDILLDENDLYLAGSFSQVDGETRNRFALINTSNGSLAPLTLNLNSTLFNLHLDGNTLYLGGSFTTVNDIERGRAASYDLDTDQLTDWNPRFNNTVNSIGSAGSMVIVGGAFSAIGETLRNRLLSFSIPDGNLNDLSIDIFSGSINSMDIDQNDLYIGGGFTTLNGESRQRLASLNKTTGVLNPLSLEINNAVNDVDVFGDELFFGGSFTQIDGNEAFRAGSYDLINQQLGNFNPKLNSVIRDITAGPSGIFISGDFTRLGFESRQNFAAVSASTSEILDFASAGTSFGSVKAIAVNGDAVYIGGNFSFFQGESRNDLAAISRTDGNLLPFNPDMSGSSVETLLLDGNMLYAGGLFTAVGGTPRTNLADINAATGQVGTIDLGTNSTIYDLEKSGSTLFLSGSFSEVDGETRSRIAAINTSNNTLLDFDGGANSSVFEIELDGSLLYVGGDFTTIGGISRARLASISTTDAAVSSWNPNLNGRVRSIEIEENYLFASGDFSLINSEAGGRLTLLDKNSGDILLGFRPILNSTVVDVLYDDGKLYTGGFFTQIGSNFNHPRFARWSVPPPGSVSFDADIVSTTDFNGFDVACNGDATAEVEVSVNGGTAPYTYLLTNNAGTISRTGSLSSSSETATESDLPAGNYNLTVEDNTSGLALASINITEPVALNADLDQLDDVSTPGGTEASLEIDIDGGTLPYDYSYLIDGSGPVTGQITSNDTPTLLENLGAGNYVFSFVDANGCATQSSIAIDDYVPVEIALTIFDEITCNGDLDGRIRILVSEGLAPYDYVLDSDDDTFDRTGTIGFSGQSAFENDLGPGEYTVSVTDATGAETTAGPITLSDPEVFTAVATVTSNVTFLGANDGEILLTISGGVPNYFYTFTRDGSPYSSGSTSSSTDDVLNLPVGVYVFTLTDANGCQFVTDPVEVLEGVDPCADLGGDADNDGICDDLDPCVGEFDAIGVCNGDCEADDNNNGICDDEELGESTTLLCSDGIDNDGDGFVDCDDPECQEINNNLGCLTCFGDGLSFADEVLDYENTCSSNGQTDPDLALGVPDFVSGANNYVSLGRGSITLGFTNNTLINSGNSDPDLFVFEIGSAVEGSTIELRPLNAETENILIAQGVPDADGDGFYDLGSIGGSTASVDIDVLIGDLGFNSVQFDAIQITDLPGSCSGSTPGADIDAVCALSSLPCVIGASCDDGNPNTENDIFDSSCNCVGTPICLADAGSLSIVNTSIELDSPEVLVSATTNGDAVVPSGFSTLYLLTSGTGLIIEQTNGSPNFMVDATGLYTIHTLVYNANPADPDFLDLSGIIFGTTPASEVLDQINDSDICASLDVDGAEVNVIPCDEGDTDGDGFCDDVDPCPLLADLENGDSCGANGTVINCECIEVCPIVLGSPSIECVTETAGNLDNYTVTIPYTGLATGATISLGNSTNCTNNFIEISGDDPTSVADGAIILTSSEEISCWSISIQSQSCDVILEGDAPSCDPGVDCPLLGLNNGDACGTNGEGTVVDCECLLPDCNGTLGGTVFDTDGDGICDDVDNCLNTPNDNQADLDGDGEGDACDNDIDGDGTINTADCAPLDPNFSTEQTYYADNDDDGFGNPDDSQIACVPPTGFVDNDDDCDDDDENINPDAQTLTFVGIGNFTNSILDPQIGSPSTVYTFSVIYTDATGTLPPIGFPRAVLDYEGNGNFTNGNDRTILLTPANSNDLNTADGKLYTGTISSLTAGSNYTARIRVADGDCVTEIGPFDYPDVLTEPDLEIFADDITFSNINPDVSSILEVTAMIRNASDLPASNFSVDLVNQFDESIDYPEITVPFIPANSSLAVTWEIITPDVPAWCPMEVFVDNTNVIIESNELDNRAIRPFVNGDFEVPGDIIADVNVSPAVQESANGNTVTIFGFAEYIDTAILLDDPSVAGGTVTLETDQGATYTGLTNSQGYFSITIPAPLTPGVYTVDGEITDFTLTGDFTVQFEITEPVVVCLPDLRPFINLVESQIFVGESTEGTVTVINQGCAPSGISTLLDLTQTGGTPILSDEIVPPLQPGESVSYDLVELTFNTAGSYVACGTADANFEVVESSESNNTDCDQILVVPPLPDIYSTSGPFGSAFLCANPANPTFNITNGGYVPTGPFDYEIDASLNGALQATFTGEVSNLNAAQSTQVSIPFAYDQLGSYTFQIRCDVPLPNGQVVEISETNNVSNYSRTILECQPDLTVLGCRQLEVDPVDPAFPGQVTYVAQVRNVGNATAEAPIDFEFQVSNGDIYQVEIDEDIAPGAQFEVTASAPTVQSGSELLTGAVDPEDLITEFSENNNSYADSLCWEFAPVPKCGTDFWNSTFAPNQTTVVSVGLDVDHLYKASQAVVRFEVEGPGITGTALLGDVAVENAETTCSCPYVVSLPNSFLFTEVGTYTFVFTADPEGDYSECNEDNNILEVEVEVTTLPDLRILSEFINPTVLNPALNESVFFDVTYENIGVSNPEDEMNLRVLVDEEELGIFENVPGLISGENTTIAFPVPYSTEIAGAHIVRAVIDSDDEIDESNELNNEATRAIVVGEAANLFFEVFQPDDASPAIGQNILIDAVIGNNGALDVNADVLFSYVNNSADTIQIGSLPVSVLTGGSQAISLPWNVQDNNTTLLGEIVNASEIEFNYDDNFASAELGAFDILITSIAFCEGETSGSLMASAEGGNPPYTFSWSNGFIGETLEAEPGMYSVTVTDNEGFEATASGTIGIDETCVEPVCDISAISFTVADNCDPITGLFDVSLTVAYENQPDIGFISVNGQDFGISGSPQSFDFEIAEGAVNFDVSFTENEDCSLFIMTGVIITPCEEDCEGVFGGDALPGSPCVIGGENGFYNENCECIPQVECSLIVNSFDITDNCDPETGLYTAFVELSYNNAPISGVLVVNEVEFEITESPQTVSLDLVAGQVVFEAFFSENPNCNTILDTGITLEACEEDCEGVFGGTALPGTPCELAGAVGIYNVDCECIPNTGCTAYGGTISTQDPMAVCKGDGNPDPIFVDLEGAVGENSIWVVTAANGLIVDITEENVFDFEETTGTGICVIWHLSWDGEIFGLEVGENAFDLEGDCFDLSNPLEIFELYVNGGEISVDGETTFCTDDGESDIVQVTVTGNVGPNGRFLLTDSDLNVLQTSQTGLFDFEGAGEGLCLIWYAAYGGPITLPESGTNVADIEGCFSLSNAIEIEKEECDDPIIADCDNWRYFLSDNTSDGSSDIYEVVLDDENGQAQMTLFKSLEYPVHIAYNESGDELYLVRSSSGSFRTLDVSAPDGAMSAEIPLDISLSGVVTTTFDASGNFYIGAESAQAVYTVDRETGATAEYADAAIAGGDIAFGTDGELYHLTRDNGGRAIKIDPEGDNEDLGSVPDLVTGLAARNDGNLMISTKDRSRLYVGDTDAMYLNKFYTLVFENEVFTMSNGDMASGCADNEPSLQSCELQAYYYANHGPGISGTDIYEVEFSENEAELTPVMNLSYQAHIAHSDDESNTLYFVNANGNFVELYDAATATITQVAIDGDINQLYAVVFNPNDGLLYVGDDNNNEVYTIDPITGETQFFVDAPISGGDLALSDGDLYLAKRDSDDLFKLIDGSFVDIGSIPDEVNGMSSTEMLDQLMVASAETSIFSRISNTDGGLIAEYTATLDGEVFTLSNGDLTSGCLDPNLEPQCMYQLFYAHNGSDGVNALLSLTANGEGGFDAEELAMNIGNAHIAVLPNGNELFVVDGSGTFKVFNLSSLTFGEEINIAAADGNITGTPAAVATPGGFLIVASSNRSHAYLVNPETGFASEIGREIPVNGGDLVFDDDGILWYINRNTGTFYDVYGEDEFSVPLGDINGAALLDDGSILLAEGNEENIMYGVDMESQALNGAEYTVPVELYWGDLAGQCLNMAYLSESANDVADAPKGWIKAYPNPNDGVATVTFRTSTDGETMVEIFDIGGRKVDQIYKGDAISNRDYQVELTRPDLPDGIYIFRLTNANETMIGKFIISK